MAPGVLDSDILGLQALEHVMRVSRTWDSIVSLLPKGGETIWGNMDWSPEEGHVCDFSKKRYSQHSLSDNNVNNSDVKRGFRVKILLSMEEYSLLEGSISITLCFS